MGKTGIIILAAGSSSRMGELKQLMKYKNKTLLQHIVGEAILAGLHPLICVTGYQSDMIKNSLSDVNVMIVYNSHWAEGMGSGIAAGVRELKQSDVDSVILAVSDQPYVSAELFMTMIDRKEQSGRGIAACSYAGTLGTPVLFGRNYFDQLMSLNGNEGAKNIVKSNLPDVCPVEFEKGKVDIDTKQDYEKLIAEIHNA